MAPKKITLLEIHDYKKLRDVTIEPGGSSLMLIGGNNTEGKSSLLGAMSAAIGGSRDIPDDPIRHGAKKASIRVVFDDGDLVVRRKFTSKGSSLEVTGPEGKISSPQKMLDQLVGKRFLDPMKFSRLSGVEQRNVLLPCVDMDIDLDASVAAEKVAYEERRDVNRDLKKLEAKLEDFGLASVPELKDHTLLLSALEELQEASRLSHDAGFRLGVCDGNQTKLENAVSAAKAAFISARDELAVAKGELEAQLPVIAAERDRLERLPVPDPNELVAARTELDACSEFNANVAKLAAERDQRVALEGEVDDLRESSESYTDAIANLKAQRTSALAAADMPIAGLSFSEDGLELNGAPFAQASGAERLRASIAISWALSPELCDVWVEDGALLDGNSLELLRQYAEDSGLRIWVERVGEADEGAIVMVDGEVS